jgi:hypothetical protein
MISLAVHTQPYSTGLNETIKLVPSLPYDSNVPLFGNTVNSVSESGVKLAVNGANYFDLFVNLKDTDEVLFRDDEMKIVSSKSGSVASKSM